MNGLQKYLSMCLLAAAALLGGTSPAWAEAPSLGAASDFAVLGGTNVTCTNGSVIGDVGVSPGSADPYTNTGCIITGGTPPATNAAAASARTAFLSAYAGLQTLSCTQSLTGTLAGQNLAPGVYCVSAEAKTGTLTLTGPSNGVWIFLVNGALTGTNFSVVMAGGGQPCNVFWAPTGAATMTTSALKGNILAGDAGIGSITLTGGTLAGSALANIAVTMTGASVVGCDALSDSKSCKGRKHHGHDKEHKKCNQGVGNGPEGCDPGNSDHDGSNDEQDNTPGNPGHKGGNK
jgi:hypothetical protein